MKTYNIKNILSFCLIFAVTNCCLAQKQTKDDKLLKDAIHSIFARVYERESYVVKKPCEFFNKKEFFTRENFTKYTKIAFTNNKEQVRRVKKLLKKIDFEYLLNFKTDTLNWNLNNVKYEKLVEKGESKSYYEIAKPIYSHDNQYAFVYFQYNCGYPNCGDFGVKVFKLCRDKWTFYINFIP